MDLTHDVPLFYGFLSGTAISAFGVGRKIHCRCVGIEIVLDWMYVPTAVSFSAGPNQAPGAILAAAIGVGVPIKMAGGGTLQSALALPTVGNATTYVTAFSVGPGTLRQCLTDWARVYYTLIDGLGTVTDMTVTVDFRGGLRTAPGVVATGGLNISDYVGVTLAVVRHEPPQGRSIVLDTSWRHETGLRTGGQRSWTGVYGGSGKPGPVVPLNDPNSLSADYLQTAAKAYLVSRGGVDFWHRAF
jgi:hypothetical protein